MPNNWKTYKLEEISSNVAYGYTASASIENVGPKFLRITDIQDNFIDWKSVPFCKIKENDLKKNKLEIGDIVVARTGNSTGATTCIKDEIDAVFASYLIRFRIDKEVANPFYIDFILRSQNWKNYVEAVKGGSAQPGANAKQFGAFELALPPLKEQKSIASILSAIDDKIENNLAINKTLEEMAMALYKHWFVDFGPFQDGEFVESELGRIPNGWEVKSVYDIANYINGAAFKPSELVDEGKYVIKISELNGGITKNTGKSTKEVKQEQIINDGSVLFSWSATLDIFLWDKGEALLNQHIFNVLPNGSLSIETLYFLLKNIIAHFKAIAADRATTMGHIKLSHLKETFLAIPNEIHKQEFQNEIEPIFSQILENLTENQTLTQLRDTLLPKLISGEVRLKEFQES